MDTNQTDSVNQSDDSGASTVTNATTNTQTVEPDRFKRDMLKYKDEANALREKVASYELDSEQKKGNLEGVINALKEENKGLKSSAAQSRFDYAQTQLDNAIRQEALSKGLSSEKVDVFMKLIDDNDKGIVELDEKFNVSSDDVKSLVDKNMERYANIGLFNKKVNVVDGTPGNNLGAKKAQKDVKDMSWDEAKAHLMSLEK
jgi:hypothetical protein